MDENEVTAIPSIPLQPATPITKPITQSILLTVKKMLGIAEEYHAFDLDIIINVNAVFLTLNQLGIGPVSPYQITGTEETWEDFLGNQLKFLAGVQTYVYQRVRLIFDPPTNSFLVDAIQKSCQEFEWRFSVQPKNQSELDYQESKKETYNVTMDSKDDDEKPTESDTKESDESTEESVSTSISTFSLKRKAQKAKPKSLLDIFS